MTNVVQAEIIAPIVIEDLNSLALRDFSVSSELSSFIGYLKIIDLASDL